MRFRTGFIPVAARPARTCLVHLPLCINIGSLVFISKPNLLRGRSRNQGEGKENIMFPGSRNGRKGMSQ
eukprot:15038245-Heterocapsa_arctica.AAC.1